MKKGFIISFSTILILSSLVLFAVFYSQKVLREETSINQNFLVEKAGFVADDITEDLNKLLATKVDVNRGQTTTTISFFDVLPSRTNKLELLDFNSFIHNQYPRQQNALINLNVEKLIDGKTEILFSSGLQYDYEYAGGQNSIQFYLPGQDTSVTAYDINLLVSGLEYDSANSQSWSCLGGAVLVRLFFHDGLNAVNSDCLLDPNAFHEYIFAFVGETGNLTVRFGNLDNNINAVRITSNIGNPNGIISTFIKAQTPSQASELSWYYDADLNYSQASAQVNRKIVLGHS